MVHRERMKRKYKRRVRRRYDGNRLGVEFAHVFHLTGFGTFHIKSGNWHLLTSSDNMGLKITGFHLFSCIGMRLAPILAPIFIFFIFSPYSFSLAPIFIALLVCVYIAPIFMHWYASSPYFHAFLAPILVDPMVEKYGFLDSGEKKFHDAHPIRNYTLNNSALCDRFHVPDCSGDIRGAKLTH